MATGAQVLLKTLVEAGVEVCFTNPGTSEMHFVAAFDGEPRLRAVLSLFEGVATGAADGYARMADKPAATLLHLGVGLGNGLANLHNARRAGVPIVNIVGDHATWHVKYDAQLQSDIETVARNVSPGFVHTVASADELGRDVAAAIAAASGPPAQVATLIVPADISWSEGAEFARVVAPAARESARDDAIDAAADAVHQGAKTALLLGGHALREAGLVAAARLAARHGVKVFAETFPTRLERGAGLPAIERLAYLAELVKVQLTGIEHLVLVEAKSPVSFFAYPGKDSDLVPAECRVHTLADPAQDAVASLQKLVATAGAADAQPALAQARRPRAPRGALTAEKVCAAVGQLLPEHAIIVDESITSGRALPPATAGAPRHDLLTLTGGAIGQGLPNAVGAAIACPGRPVLALVGDGAAMYTIQALWTMAHEQLDVTTIIFNNAAYSILNVELARTGARSIGARAHAQLDLAGPALDFARLAQCMGVHAVRARDAEDLDQALHYAFSTPGPHLVDALVPESLDARKRKVLPWVLDSLPRLPQPVGQVIKNKIAP
jgi:acetolactate synthase-1/2/3 large subunit